MSISSNSIATGPADPLDQFFNPGTGMYCMGIGADLPAFDLLKGDTIWACGESPKPGDIVVCSIDRDSTCAAFGKLLARKGARAILETADGTLTLILTRTVASIVKVERI